MPGLGLRQGSTQTLSVSSPSPRPPLSSHPPGRHSFPVLRPARMFSETPIPAWEERLALQAPPLVVSLPHDPTGLACKSLFSGLCVSPSALPSPRLLALAPAPTPVCPCKHKSTVCADKAVRPRGGRACRRDISRELWGRRLGGQRRLSDSRDSASSSRGLGRAPGASGCGW